MMELLMLIVRMADETIAMPADMIESVVEIEAMSPIPLAPPHIAGLAALRSRVITIVDPRTVLGLPATELAMPFSVVVVAIEGHPYGIVVDDVLDVLPADGPPRAVNGMASAHWGAIACGTVVIGDRQYLMADPAGLVAGTPVRAEAVR